MAIETLSAPATSDRIVGLRCRSCRRAEPIGLARGLDGREAIEVIERAAIDVARLTVRYGRAG